MTLRIAVDLDGTLADMEGELARHAHDLFGEAIARRHEPAESAPTSAGDAPAADSSAAGQDDVPTLWLELTARQQNRLWRHVRSLDNFWETLPELEPGVVSRLGALARERGWEIIFLTKRPSTAGATAQVQSQRWLQANGFDLPSVFVVQGSRGRIAAALDVDIVIDDRPENCLDVVVDSRARPILVWRDDEAPVPAAAQRVGVGVVRSVARALEILVEADAAAQQQKAGLLARVKRALGL